MVARFICLALIHIIIFGLIIYFIWIRRDSKISKYCFGLTDNGMQRMFYACEFLNIIFSCPPTETELNFTKRIQQTFDDPPISIRDLSFGFLALFFFYFVLIDDKNEIFLKSAVWLYFLYQQVKYLFDTVNLSKMVLVAFLIIVIMLLILCCCLCGSGSSENTQQDTNNQGEVSFKKWLKDNH